MAAAYSLQSFVCRNKIYSGELAISKGGLIQQIFVFHAQGDAGVISAHMDEPLELDRRPDPAEKTCDLVDQDQSNRAMSEVHLICEK